MNMNNLNGYLEFYNGLIYKIHPSNNFETL